MNVSKFYYHLQEFLAIQHNPYQIKKSTLPFFLLEINMYLMKFYLTKYHLHYSDVQSMKLLN